MKRPILLLAAVFLLVCVVATLVAGRSWWTRLHEPYQGDREAEQFVDIPSGAGSVAIQGMSVAYPVRARADRGRWV